MGWETRSTMDLRTKQADPVKSTCSLRAIQLSPVRRPSSPSSPAIDRHGGLSHRDYYAGGPRVSARQRKVESTLSSPNYRPCRRHARCNPITSRPTEFHRAQGRTDFILFMNFLSHAGFQYTPNLSDFQIIWLFPGSETGLFIRTVFQRRIDHLDIIAFRFLLQRDVDRCGSRQNGISPTLFGALHHDTNMFIDSLRCAVLQPT